MTISLKADSSGTFGEVLVNGSPALKVSNGLLELPDGKDFFNQGNIVGTVSQSGGIPTGAVVERGSNANGEYVRFADGTQICTIYKTKSNSTLANGVHYTSIPWDFPALFITPPAVTASGFVNLVLAWGSADAQATTASTSYLNVFANVAHAQTAHARGVAIGRWF